MGEKKDRKMEPSQQQSKSCFVIMPISDAEGYDSGHFERVFNYVIKPACEKAGFTANRADQSSKTNYIVIDILRQIINSDMAICDLSSRNSNVFFELGLRQAFNLKTVLIKDSKTPRSFDISGLRCIDYDEKLRVDNVEGIINKIADTLKDTMESKEEEVNSLIQLLAVDAAKLPDKVKLSNETGMILSEIKRLRNDMLCPTTEYINPMPHFIVEKPKQVKIKLPNAEIADLYSNLYLKSEDMPFNDNYGVIIDKREDYTVVKKDNDIVKIMDTDDIWGNLTIKDSAY